MSNGIYVALSANVAAEKNMDVVSNNLANATTVGFKKEKSIFYNYVHKYKDTEIPEKMKIQGTPQDKNFVDLDDTYTDFQMGSLKNTGNPLDFAISGDGFFKVEKDGTQFFQRQGVFMRGTDGTLICQDGASVLDINGAPIILQPDKEVHVTEKGEIFQGEVAVATIGMSTVDNKSWLEKRGDTRYVLTGQGAEIPSEEAMIHQGFLESANVNAVAEMVEMIKANRHYEAAAKAIKTYQNMDDKAINKVGVVS